MNRPTITAHSGCEGTADGSLSAIRRGIELGADLVEVDVRRVPGLGLALTHDAPADINGLVTLEEAFRELARHPETGVNCDLKEYGLAKCVLALAEDCGLISGQLAFSGSLTPSQLASDPSIARRARVYLNIEEALCELYRERNPGAAPTGAHPWDVVKTHMAERLDPWIEPLIAACKASNIRALNLPPRPFIRPHLARLAAAGVRCSVWTIDEPGAMRELFPLPNLDNLTTRQVALAVSVRASIHY